MTRRLILEMVEGKGYQVEDLIDVCRTYFREVLMR